MYLFVTIKLSKLKHEEADLAFGKKGFEVECICKKTQYLYKINQPKVEHTFIS